MLWLIEPAMALFKASLALWMVWATLRTFDHLSGITFGNDLLPKILEGNMACATYCGARFLGASVLGGLVFFIPV